VDEAKDTEVAGHHPILSTQNPDKLALMMKAFPFTKMESPYLGTSEFDDSIDLI
jgi:hypothetical protein